MSVESSLLVLHQQYVSAAVGLHPRRRVAGDSRRFGVGDGLVHAARGNGSVTVVPPPTALAIATRPAAVVRSHHLGQAKAEPLPMSLVVKNGSNTRACT